MRRIPSRVAKTIAWPRNLWARDEGGDLLAPWWLRANADERTADGEASDDEFETNTFETGDFDDGSADDGSADAGPSDDGRRGGAEGSKRPWWLPGAMVDDGDEGDSADGGHSDGDSPAGLHPDDLHEDGHADSDDLPGDTDLDQAAGDSASEDAGGRKRRRRRRRRRKRKGASQDGEAAGETHSHAASFEDAPSPAPRPAGRPDTGPPYPAQGGVAPPAPSVGEQGLLFTLPDLSGFNDERKIAMFCDFENIAIGVRDSEIKKLDINLVLSRLLEKGKIIVKKAYADWERYSDYKRPFHEAAIELIDIPQKYYSGKNSADIKMVVDAMDLCYSKEHLDTFVIVSGDSDFSPLVSKLKENNKYVIGIGVKKSSSNLLIDNCDEFIYYEDVWRTAQLRPSLDNLPPKQAEAFRLMSDAMLALIRENKEVLWGSMIKQTMQRMRPSFNETYYGYSTFSELLQDAARKKIIDLERDQRSGNMVVTGFAHRH